MGIYTTEITSDTIASDNPIHQRLFKAYHIAKPFVKGRLLEIGCGQGRGTDVLAPLADHYSAIDKISSVIESLQSRMPGATFIQGNVPPLPFEDNSFDCIISFQVIEHIQDDFSFLTEIRRVLVPGGVAMLTTPNKLLSLTRNPWHIREYTAAELTKLAETVFDKVQMRGIAGNKKVMAYYERNKKSVERITKYDIFDLQHRLPAALLRIPYDILNRLNRNNLERHDDLVVSITHEDYLLTDEAPSSLDLFCTLY